MFSATRSVVPAAASAAALTILAALPANANPLQAPTANFIADVELTRESDHAVRMPARYVMVGRKISVDYNGLVRLVDLDRKQVEPMIPRVKTYWKPEPISGAALDARYWIGVQADTAEPIGTDTMLGRAVTKYRVSGKIFDTATPFEGEVWTTAENIVVRVDGTGKGTDEKGRPFTAPVKVTAVQLAVGNVDPALVAIPPTFARAVSGTVSYKDD
jgi:hypothetical protein